MRQTKCMKRVMEMFSYREGKMIRYFMTGLEVCKMRMKRSVKDED